MSRLTIVNPPGIETPRGFSHGVLAPAGGRLLFVAGQTAPAVASPAGPDSFALQFEAVLTRVVAVVGAAGGAPDQIARMTVYVRDMPSYLASRRALGEIWRRHMGRHYPAMAVVEVSRLVSESALLEIEATAVLP